MRSEPLPRGSLKIWMIPMTNYEIRAYSCASPLQKHAIGLLMSVSSSSGFIPYHVVRLTLGRNMKLPKNGMRPILSELKEAGLIILGNRGIFIRRYGDFQ